MQSDSIQNATNTQRVDPNAQYKARAAELGQLAWLRQQEREAMAKTAETISGQILQITDGGILLKYTWINYDAILCFVEDADMRQMVDGGLVRGLKVYPIGTYTYTTVAGGSKTVKRFTTSIDKAIEWHRNNR